MIHEKSSKHTGAMVSSAVRGGEEKHDRNTESVKAQITANEEEREGERASERGVSALKHHQCEVCLIGS